MIQIALYAALWLQEPAPAPQSRDELVKAEVDKAVKSLEDAQRVNYSAARQTLIELSHASVPALIGVLKDSKSTQARFLACDVLGELRAVAAVAALKERLADRELFGVSVASKAAWALGKIGDAAAIEPLMKLLAEGGANADANLKYETIGALGFLRAREAVAEIKKCVTDKGKGDYGQPVAGAAIQALARLQAKEAADDIALALDDTTADDWNVLHGGWQVRHLAALALQELTGEKHGEMTGAADVRDKTADAWKDWRDNRKKVALSKERIAVIAAAIEAFMKDHENKPPENLGKLREGDKPYLKIEDSTVDGWENPINYRTPGWGADYDVFSLGSDKFLGGPGSKADLFNHDKWLEHGKTETEKRLKEIVDAIKKFQPEQGRAPLTLQDLKTRPASIPKDKWPQDGYYQGLTNDGWGQPLDYVPPQGEGKPWILRSLGYDGKTGGDGPDADVLKTDVP